MEHRPMITRSSVFVTACLLASMSLAAEPKVNHNHSQPKWIAGDSPIIPIISKDRMVLSAYSAETSKWAQLKLESPLPDGILPTNQSGFVVIQTNDAIYAVNAYAGQWARLTFVGEHKKPFDMSQDFVLVSDERGVFIFGKKATKWQGINSVTGELLNLEGENRTPPRL